MLAGDSPHPNGERKVKGPYFEFAKKKWETEDTFRHPSILVGLVLGPQFGMCRTAAKWICLLCIHSLLQFGIWTRWSRDRL